MDLHVCSTCILKCKNATTQYIAWCKTTVSSKYNDQKHLSCSYKGNNWDSFRLPTYLKDLGMGMTVILNAVIHFALHTMQRTLYKCLQFLLCWLACLAEGKSLVFLATPTSVKVGVVSKTSTVCLWYLLRCKSNAHAQHELSLMASVCPFKVSSFPLANSGVFILALTPPTMLS